MHKLNKGEFPPDTLMAGLWLNYSLQNREASMRCMMIPPVQVHNKRKLKKTKKIQRSVSTAISLPLGVPGWSTCESDMFE